MKLTSIQAQAAVELAERKKMAALLFRPQEHQEEIFVQPRPKYMLVGGGNRGGKTISLAELTTLVALDLPITFADGRQFDARMPHQKNRPLTIWLVCIDQRHIGDVLYPALFKAGAFERFKVVFDPVTKAWRAYDYENDPARGLKPQQHPPLIPKRYLKSDAFSWESKADRIFNKVTLTDPVSGEVLAEIHAFTSKGDPPQGRSIDFCWCDEQLARDKFIDELKARLVDRDGQLVWSSWNDEDSNDLNSFSQMIDREIEAGTGLGKKVSLSMTGNKLLDKKAVAEFLAGCGSDEERLQRDQGIAPSEKLRMYPLFHKEYHSAIVDGPEEDELSRILRRTDGIPPNEWTKTLVLDPGRQHPAVLLCAVPPPALGPYFVPYQEFYPGRADHIQLTQLVRKETLGERFYRFLADMRAGRQSTMGMLEGERVIDKYKEAFIKFGMECVATKSGFLTASDNVGARQLTLQAWMHPTKFGFPQLRIVTHRCPNLCEQLRKLKKDTTRKEVVDERKMPGQPDDCAVCLEYFAASHPRYIPMPAASTGGGPGYKWYMKKFGVKPAQSVRIGTSYS
jgi:hypothetical protein